MAFGMGVNIPDTQTVIHFDSPSGVDNYLQEVGHVGKDGALSHAILVVLWDTQSSAMKKHVMKGDVCHSSVLPKLSGGDHDVGQL